MELTKSQCELMINMLNASIEHSMKSGIPIGKEYYYDLEKIKEELYQEAYGYNQKGGFGF